MAKFIAPILTLDISSSATGAALYYRGRVIAVECFKVKGDYARLIEMGKQFRSFLVDHLPPNRPLEVWVETPFYCANKSHDLPIKMAHGVLLFVCGERVKNYSWNYVAVATWRKEFKIHKLPPKQKKEVVRYAMAHKFGCELSQIDDNIGDALGILNWRLTSNG